MGGRAGTRYPAATPTPLNHPHAPDRKGPGQHDSVRDEVMVGWVTRRNPGLSPHQGHSGLHRQAVGQPGVPMKGGGGSEVSGDLSAEQASFESLWRCCLFR